MVLDMDFLATQLSQIFEPLLPVNSSNFHGEKDQFEKRSQ